MVRGSVTTLFLRKLTLLVGSNSGDGLDLSEMQVSFAVRHGVASTPKNAAIRVYNLSDSTTRTVQSYAPSSLAEPAIGQVILQAGYETGQFGLLFRGEIKQIRTGRESSVDSYIDIFAADGDPAHNNAVMNTTLGAGWTPKDHLAAALKTFEPYGITGGETPAYLGTQQMPRGRVCYGMTRDQLHDLGGTNGFTWTLEDGRWHAIAIDGSSASGTAIELNSRSGLIGYPQQTQDGIAVRCLLNPNIKVDTLIHLNERSIIQAVAPLDAQGIPLPNPIDADGIYRVLFVDHAGDTRGQDWYTDLVCATRDPTRQPISGAVVSAVPD